MKDMLFLNSKKKINASAVSFICYLLIGFISSVIMAFYSGMSSVSLATVFFFLLFLSLGYHAVNISSLDFYETSWAVHHLEKVLDLSRAKLIMILLFSLLFSLSLLFGNHVHVENGYSGLMDVNYIVPYTAKDFFAVIFLCIYSYAILLYLYTFWKVRQDGIKIKMSSRIITKYQKKNKKYYQEVVIGAALLFVCWLPYFLIYYPGYIFGDSLSSIMQAMGDASMINDHPILYTFFIKCCLMIGKSLGSLTLGCAVYSILQMIYISFALSSVICWCGMWFRKKFWMWGIILLMGAQAYLGQMSIAMWKDPVFSVTIVVLTVKIMDYIMSSGKVAEDDRFYWIKFCILNLIIIFSRNNGIYLLIFFMLVTLIVWMLDKKKQHYLGSFCTVTMWILIFSYMITGPVYHIFGLSGGKEEAYGIFIAQMARIAAYDGHMSLEDLQYMDALYQPSDNISNLNKSSLEKIVCEKYKTTYYPCCIDILKWSADFHKEELNHHFFRHYFSMIIKNPILAVEGWGMMTYGFWTVNNRDINRNEGNILTGVPRNVNIPTGYEGQYAGYDIHSSNLLHDDALISYFPYSEMTIPIGMLIWLLMILALFFILSKITWMLPVIAPALGLAATLVIASPIYFWSRYGAAFIYMIPFLIMMYIFSYKN